jgi:hypothetical protein
VEPIRLGLGHLGHADPAALQALLTDLLTGPDVVTVSTVVIPSLRELRGVRAAHIELIVTGLLETDAQAGDAGSFEASAPLSLLVNSPVTLPGGERPVDVVNRALASALSTAAEPGLVAAAARAVESLGLFPRETAETLFRAQHLDGPDHGWATVREPLGRVSMLPWGVERGCPSDGWGRAHVRSRDDLSVGVAGSAG